MYIVNTMNSTTTTPIPSLMAGAAKLAKELAVRKADANAGAAMTVNGVSAEARDGSKITIFKSIKNGPSRYLVK